MTEVPAAEFQNEAAVGTDPSTPNVDLFAALAAGHRFLLGAVELAPNGLNPTDTLLLLAVIEANAAKEARDAASRYARLEDVPPTERRRPISILAVASSLNLPFETTRRRIHRLARAGYCEVSRKGCVVPAHLLAGPDYDLMTIRTWSLLHRLCGELSAAGASKAWPAKAGPVPSPRAPLRLMNRILGDYILRTLSFAPPPTGDLVDRLILMAVHVESRGATSGLRAKVRFARIAALARVGPEAARRRLQALRVGGLVDSQDGDWRLSIAGEAVLRTSAEAHLVSVRRALAELQRIGVVSTRTPATSGDAAN